MAHPKVNDSVKPVYLFGEREPENPATLSTIGNTSSDLINYPDGIPSVYEAHYDPQTKQNTGLKVLLPDINAIGNMATKEQWFKQCGGIHTYNPDLVALGVTYPKYAVLDYWSESQQKLRRVMSLIDNNNYNFNASKGGNESWIDGVHWAYCDKFDFNQYAIFDVPPLKSVVTTDRQWYAPYDCECNIFILARSATVRYNQYSSGFSGYVSVSAYYKNKQQTVLMAALKSSGSSIRVGSVTWELNSSYPNVAHFRLKKGSLIEIGSSALSLGNNGRGGSYYADSYVVENAVTVTTKIVYTPLAPSL